MDIRDALKGQYHATFRMLTDCLECCPDEMWTMGKFPREFWRIAYHAAFYGHFYMSQGEDSFEPWPKHRIEAVELWEEDAVEVGAYTRAEVLDYITWIRERTDAIIDSLDLDTTYSGFPWYQNITKLEHEILSIRHVQGHVGQLSELLMARGIESQWISRRA